MKYTWILKYIMTYDNDKQQDLPFNGVSLKSNQNL